MRWTVKQGDILAEPADVLVCSANVLLNLSGGVGGEILRRYGDAMQKELHCYLADRNLPHAQPGDVIPTACCGTPFKAVLHAVAVDAFYGSSAELVRSTVTTALRMAASLGARKIALVALATGYGRLSILDFAEAIKPLSTLELPSIGEVVVCLPGADQAAGLARALHGNAAAESGAERLNRIAGVLLGTAVGDAIGLPREGLSPRRAARLFGGAPIGHRFLFGRGMVSDDTEHACMTAQALLAGRGDPARFARSLAWRLRFWLLGLPAGVGLATARGILRLWIGFPPGRSGVHSAGNGPAMRSPVLGVCAGEDPERLRALVSASTRLTHTDERAGEGALAVALCCRYAATRPAEKVAAGEVFDLLRREISNAPLRNALDLVEKALGSGQTAAQWASQAGLGSGVTGYILHTVPAAVLCWLRHPADFRAAVEEVVLLGGDADTTGAITGALAGATVGAKGIPPEWVAGLWEWPRSVGWIHHLAERLAARDDAAARPVHLSWPAILPRNVLFLAVVLRHGLRRLLPPY